MHKQELYTLWISPCAAHGARRNRILRNQKYKTSRGERRQVDARKLDKIQICCTNSGELKASLGTLFYGCISDPNRGHNPDLFIFSLIFEAIAP